MTRRIDRVHELRRRNEPVISGERGQAVHEAGEAALRETLGIPTGMQLSFSRVTPGQGTHVDISVLPRPDDLDLRPWRVYYVATLPNGEAREYLVSAWPDRATAEAAAGPGCVVRDHVTDPVPGL